MIPDPRWLSALKLPTRVIAGLFLFALALLLLNYLGGVPLVMFGALTLPTVVVLTALFACLSLAAIGEVIYDRIMSRHKASVITPGGVYDMDHFPFCFVDFVWKALLARKDDENKRKAKEEEAARARRSRY